MRSSAILLAALVGAASAAMPKWAPMSWGSASVVSGGGVGATGKPHLGPGPVQEHHEKDHYPKKEHHSSGGIFPTGPVKDHGKDHYPNKEHHSSGGIFPTGSPKKHHPAKYHHRPTGSGMGPTATGAGTGTGHGGIPPSTTGPLTTTITTTADVTSK